LWKFFGNSDKKRERERKSDNESLKISRKDRKELEIKLKDELWLERRWACVNLGIQASPKSFFKLIHLLDDPNAQVKIACIEAIVEFPRLLITEEILAKLIGLLTDINGGVQLTIQKALIEIDSERFRNNSIRQILRNLTPFEKEYLFNYFQSILMNDKTEKCLNTFLALADIGVPEVENLFLRFTKKISYNIKAGGTNAYTIVFFKRTLELLDNIHSELHFDPYLIYKLLVKESNLYFKRVLLEIMQRSPLNKEYYYTYLSLLDDNVSIRKIAIKILGKLRDSRAIVPLILQFRPNQIQTTNLIIESLKKIDYNRFSNSNVNNWKGVYLVLTDVEKSKIIPILLDYLKIRHSILQIHARDILVVLKDEKYLPELYRLLLIKDTNVKFSIIQVLKAWKFKSAVIHLINQLVDADFTLESKIFEALTSILPKRFKGMTKQEILQKLSKYERSILTQSIIDRDPSLAKFYFKIKEKKLNPMENLQMRYQNFHGYEFYDKVFDAGKPVSESHLSLVAQIPEQENEEFLIHLLSHPKDYIQKSAIQTLGLLQSHLAVPYLIQMIEQPYRQISNLSEVLIIALSKIGEYSAIDSVLHCFRHGSTSLNKILIKNLKFFDTKWIEERLPEYSESIFSNIRMGIAYLIGSYKLWHGDEILIKLSKDGVLDVQKMATYAMGEVQTKKIFFRLEELFLSSEIKLKLAALISIGKFPIKYSKQTILKALKDRNIKIKQSAAILLGMLGNRDAIPELRKIILDSSSSIRLSAIESLKKIGSKKAFGILLNAFNYPRQDLRDSIKENLNYLLVNQPSMALSVLYNYYYKNHKIIPSYFHLYEIIPSLTGAQLKGLKNLEFGYLVRQWIKFGHKIAYNLLKAFGYESVAYIERYLKKFGENFTKTRIIELKMLMDSLIDQNRISSKDPNFEFML
jgi:HEAT repeat protein